jgi:hypothetical protein
VDEVGAADGHARLRPAQELVARERDQRGARVDGLTDARLVAQPRRPMGEPRSRLVEEPGAGVDHDRRPEPGQVTHRGRLDEADHPVVGRVDLEHERGLGTDGVGVVGAPGPVRRPDFDQATTRLRHDLGNPEAAADLDELAP